MLQVYRETVQGMEGPELDQNVILKPLEVFRGSTNFVIGAESLVFNNDKLMYGSNLGSGFNRFESIKAPYLKDYPTNKQAWRMIDHCVTKETKSFPSLEALFVERKTSLFGFVCFDGKVVAVSKADQPSFVLHITPPSVSPTRYSLSVDSRKLALVLLTGLSEKEIIIYDVLKR